MRKLMLTTPVDEKIAFVGVDRIMQTSAFRMGRTFLMRSNRSSMLVWGPSIRAASGFELQRQIDTIRKDFGDLNSPKDALKSMQRRIDELERMLRTAAKSS